MRKIGKTLKISVLVPLAIVLTAGASFALFGLGKCEKVRARNGEVSIPLAKVSDGKAHFYRYDEGGKEISFFIVKGRDGATRVAFDACDVCFHEKKGYEQAGNSMVCKNCNRKFATDRIGPHAVGGCNPSHLAHREDGGHILIAVEDIRAGARFF